MQLPAPSQIRSPFAASTGIKPTFSFSSHPVTLQKLTENLIIDHIKTGHSIILDSKVYDYKFLKTNNIAIKALRSAMFPYVMYVASREINKYFGEDKKYFIFNMNTTASKNVYLTVELNQEDSASSAFARDFLIIAHFILYTLKTYFFSQPERDINVIEKSIIVDML